MVATNLEDEDRRLAERVWPGIEAADVLFDWTSMLTKGARCTFVLVVRPTARELEGVAQKVSTLMAWARVESVIWSAAKTASPGCEEFLLPCCWLSSSLRDGSTHAVQGFTRNEKGYGMHVAALPWSHLDIDKFQDGPKFDEQGRRGREVLMVEDIEVIMGYEKGMVKKLFQMGTRHSPEATADQMGFALTTTFAPAAACVLSAFLPSGK